MTFLNVMIAIVLFFTLLFAIPIRINIDYSDEVRLTLNIAHLIRIKLLPKREKKVRLRDYTPKKIAKREKARKKKEEKARLKRKLKAEEKKRRKLEKQARKEAEKSGAIPKQIKPSLLDNVRFVTSLTEMFLKKFFRRLKIKVARLNITVATEDAAKTAILYGAVSQAVSYLIALLDSNSNLKQVRRAQFNVNADFCATKSSADVYLSFSIRVGQILLIGLSVLFKFVKYKLEWSQKSENNKTNSNKKK